MADAAADTAAHVPGSPFPTAADQVDDPGTDLAFSYVCDLAEFVWAHVLRGTLWVGWHSRFGQPAYGDGDNPPPDEVVVVDPAVDAVQAALLAGAVTFTIGNQVAASQAQRRASSPGVVMPGNRAQRRAAARRVGNGGGLVLP